jgi:PPOX class probable F420-dependent enzyme
MALPDNVKQLFTGKNYGIVVTRRADGTPQSTPVWVDTDGEHVMFNTNTIRAKYKHLQRDPWIAITVLPSQDLQSGYVTVYGKAVEFDTEHGGEHIDAMSKKYLGQDTYPYLQPGEQRVIVKVKPESYDGYGVGAQE